MKGALVMDGSWRVSVSVCLTLSCALHPELFLLKTHKVLLCLSARYLCGRHSKASLPGNYNSNVCVFKYIQWMKYNFLGLFFPASRILNAQIL